MSLSELSSSGTSTSSDDGYDSDEELRLIQQEWEDSLRQLRLLISVVLLPYFGKWLGRRWSHWAFARYQHLGLGRAFFFGQRTAVVVGV